MGLVRIPLEWDGIGKNISTGRGRVLSELSEFLWEWMGLVRTFLGVEVAGQNFSVRDSLGLDKIALGCDWIDQNFLWEWKRLVRDFSGWDWTKFLWDGVRLVRISLGGDRIGQNSFGMGLD